MDHKKYWKQTRVKGAYRQGRKDAIDEIKQSFHNVYSASLYCLEDMAENCKENGCNCDDCLYVMFNKVLEQLKEEI